jgi:hypothetical protein
LRRRLARNAAERQNKTLCRTYGAYFHKNRTQDSRPEETGDRRNVSSYFAIHYSGKELAGRKNKAARIAQAAFSKSD